MRWIGTPEVSNATLALIFDRWLREFTIKGFVSDKTRLENRTFLSEDWAKRLDAFIARTDGAALQDAGKVKAEIARAHAESEFKKYRVVQDWLSESDFDRMLRQIDTPPPDTDVTL